jgi:processive 1,2-diacylglycerol beta-glucosyltransferase
LGLVTRAPWLWDLAYDSAAVAGVAGLWRKAYAALAGRRLEKRLAELEPGVVVCTSAPPMAAILEARRRAGARWPVAAVITDFHAHRYWLEPPADLYLTATEAGAIALKERGVPDARVRATGIPIDPVFARPLDPARRRRHGVEGSDPVILISGGSRGLGGVEAAVAALAAGVPRAALIVLCGSNDELRARVTVRFPGVVAYPAVEPALMRELMADADLLVGKAGGVTCAEALAAGLPMIIYDPLPGQEAGNARYLQGVGAAVLADGPAKLGPLAAEVFASRRHLEMRERARAQGQPGAAAAALDSILSLKLLY